jgi:hypothetical protein
MNIFNSKINYKYFQQFGRIDFTKVACSRKFCFVLTSLDISLRLDDKDVVNKKNNEHFIRNLTKFII